MSQHYPLPANTDMIELNIISLLKIVEKKSIELVELITDENNKTNRNVMQPPFILKVILNDSTSNDPALTSQHALFGENMSLIYRFAYKSYLKGQVDQAETLYQFLCTHDMYNADYLMGLAAINFQKKNFDKAVNLYVMCLNLEEDNYLAMLYAGQCSMLSNKPVHASVFFNAIINSKAPPGVKSNASTLLSTM